MTIDHTRFVTLERAIQELSLGSTTEVADLLVEHGCHGHRHLCRGCPVASYLAKRTGVCQYVCQDMRQGVSQDVRPYVVLNEIGLVIAVLPPVIARFIFEFDCGDHPRLDLDLSQYADEAAVDMKLSVDPNDSGFKTEDDEDDSDTE